MKIGLYLEDHRKDSDEDFFEFLLSIKTENFDLFVFPESTYIPFEKRCIKGNIFDSNIKECVTKNSLEISEELGCPIILGWEGKFNNPDDFIYSVYANAFAKDGETKNKIFLKNTSTPKSPLFCENYEDSLDCLFDPIILNNKKIGVTICYDCNHSAFSRGYKKSNIDILINSSGGNVVYHKWYRYNKIRAIENKCFSFCTMGFEENKKANSYTFGFTPNGKPMKYKPLNFIINEWDKIGNIFIYDTDEADTGYKKDINLKQKETKNNRVMYKLDIKNLGKLIESMKKIEEKIYVEKFEKFNIVFCFVDKNNIEKPEEVLKLLYNPKLKDIENKRYIIINKWDDLNKDYFENILSDILKVRAMENYCAVLLLTTNCNKCYQTTYNRNPQVLKPIDNIYGFDLIRMTGPELIWKNKKKYGSYMMKKSWRKGFEKLIEYIS